jgi:hypothetical protein
MSLLIPNRFYYPRRTRVVPVGVGQPDNMTDISYFNYFCKDCVFLTNDPQSITDHQKKWHGWRCFFSRLKES